MNCDEHDCKLIATAAFVEIEDRRLVSEKNLCEQHGVALTSQFHSEYRLASGLPVQFAGATCFDVALLIYSYERDLSQLFLREVGGRQLKQYGIGYFEMSAIYNAVRKTPCPRPMTYEAMVSIIRSLGGVLENVLVDETSDNRKVHHAKLRIRLGRQLVLVDSRPSDALALAIHAGVPFFISNDLLLEV
jgi:bifunctional DNase/RNase